MTMDELTMDELKIAALLYCERTNQAPDELILDALTMEKTLPRWEKIRDHMLSRQIEAQCMADVMTGTVV